MARNNELKQIDILKKVIPEEIRHRLKKELHSELNWDSITFWNDLIAQLNLKLVKYYGFLSTAQEKVKRLEKLEKEFKKLEKPIKTAEAIQILKSEGYAIEINAKERQK